MLQAMGQQAVVIKQVHHLFFILKSLKVPGNLNVTFCLVWKYIRDVMLCFLIKKSYFMFVVYVTFCMLFCLLLPFRNTGAMYVCVYVIFILIQTLTTYKHKLIDGRKSDLIRFLYFLFETRIPRKENGARSTSFNTISIKVVTFLQTFLPLIEILYLTINQYRPILIRLGPEAKQV